MGKVKIALIDSGVEINHPHLYNRHITGIEAISRDDGSFYFRNSNKDSNGHGTALAGIITDKCPDAEILSVKIFDKNLNCSIKTLESAFKWVLKEDVQIINLSLGFVHKDNTGVIEKLCKKAYDKGIYVLSAFNNKGISSYPAVFDTVIGVYGRRIKYKYGYIYDPKKNNIIANGDIQKVYWNDGRYKYVYGNSFACANATGIIAKFIRDNPLAGYEEIKSIINNKSMIMNEEDNDSDERGWIHNVLLCPLSNENLNMAMTLKDSSVKCIGIYDLREAYYPEYNEDFNGKKIRIKIFNDLKEGLQDADTLIVGNMDFMPQEKEKSFKEAVIRYAINEGRNVLSKDDILIDESMELYDFAHNKGVKLASGHI